MKNISTFEEYISKDSKKANFEKPSNSEETGADSKNEELDKEDDTNEGNRFTKALKDAREQGLKEFEFNGKTYKVFEKGSPELHTFLAENFTLYPSYNNMLGSEVMRNVPITHQVNMAVYGKAYVVEMPLNNQVIK